MTLLQSSLQDELHQEQAVTLQKRRDLQEMLAEQASIPEPDFILSVNMKDKAEVLKGVD